MSEQKQTNMKTKNIMSSVTQDSEKSENTNVSQDRPLWVELQEVFFYCLKCETAITEEKSGVCPSCQTDHFNCDDAKKLTLIASQKPSRHSSYLVSSRDNLESLKLIYLRYRLNTLFGLKSSDCPKQELSFAVDPSKVELDEKTVGSIYSLQKTITVSIQNLIRRRKNRMALYFALQDVKDREKKHELTTFWISTLFEDS